MENENSPMDFDARTDAAMSALDSEPAVATQDPASQEAAPAENGAEQQAQPQDPNALEQTQEAQPLELTDDQRLADPQFKELSEFRAEVESTFAEFGIPDAAQAKLQLSDAQVLYQIANGQAAPSQLLNLLAQNWKPEQVAAVAQDLAQWLQKGGFLKNEQGATAKPGDKDFKDPLVERLDKIEKETQTRQQQEAQQRETQRRETVFKDKYLPAVENLCKQKGVPQEDVLQYSDAIAKMINGNAMILKRIENGNTVDIQRLFSQVHNAESKRWERYNASRTKQQQVKSSNPRIPSGGAPPAPAGSAKQANPKDRDSRIAAAMDAL